MARSIVLEAKETGDRRCSGFGVALLLGFGIDGTVYIFYDRHGRKRQVGQHRAVL